MTLPSAPWTGPVPVEVLVSGALRRERRAERELYQRYSPPVRRFALERLRNAHDAADVVQETFARAFRLLPTLARPAEFVPWLHGIARNVCRECLKLRKRATRPLPALALAPPAVATPEHELMGRQTTNAVLRALAALPAARREALRLRVESGFAYQEIAALLGWSLPKAKVEVHRARRALDAAVRGKPRRGRWLGGGLALSMLLLFGSLLVGAGPGELPEPVLEGSVSAGGECAFPAADASDSPASASTACFAPAAPAEIPWSDAPVTKALEAP